MLVNATGQLSGQVGFSSQGIHRSLIQKIHIHSLIFESQGAIALLA